MKPTASAWALTLAAVLTLGWATACAQPAPPTAEKPAAPKSEGAAEPASTSGSPSEAAKTRELQEKAAGYEERFKEIQDSDMTAEQKAQAASELVDEQQRTVHEAEDGPAGEEPSDPPPPR